MAFHGKHANPDAIFSYGNLAFAAILAKWELFVLQKRNIMNAKVTVEEDAEAPEDLLPPQPPTPQVPAPGNIDPVVNEADLENKAREEKKKEKETALIAGREKYADKAKEYFIDFGI